MPTPPYIKQNNKKPLQKTNELLHDVNETASQNTNLKNKYAKSYLNQPSNVPNQ
jgi:hypothetical protein